MMAVWGIFRPMGYLNSAVTANQSASAPTMPPSAAARTYSSHGYCLWNANATVKITAIAISSARANRFMRSNAAAFSMSPADSSTTAERPRAGAEPAVELGLVTSSVGICSEFTCISPA
ncbi:hypothetical protein D3C73_1386830 [compost metagenome]